MESFTYFISISHYHDEILDKLVRRNIPEISYIPNNNYTHLFFLKYGKQCVHVHVHPLNFMNAVSFFHPGVDDLARLLRKNHFSLFNFLTSPRGDIVSWMRSRECAQSEILNTVIRVANTNVVFSMIYLGFALIPVDDQLTYTYTPNTCMLIGNGGFQCIHALVTSDPPGNSTLIVTSSDVDEWLELFTDDVSVTSKLTESPIHTSVVIQHIDSVSAYVYDYMWPRVVFHHCMPRYIHASTYWLLWDHCDVDFAHHMLNLNFPNVNLPTVTWLPQNTRGSVVYLKPNNLEMTVANNRFARFNVIHGTIPETLVRTKWENIPMFGNTYFVNTLQSLQKHDRECGVCLLYTCDVLLLCGHTMCITCFINVYVSSKTCPWCRTTIDFNTFWNNTNFEFTSLKWLTPQLSPNTLVVCKTLKHARRVRNHMVKTNVYTKEQARRNVTHPNAMLVLPHITTVFTLGVKLKHCTALFSPDATRFVQIMLDWT